MFERPQLTVVDFEIRDILTGSNEGGATEPSGDPELPGDDL